MLKILIYDMSLKSLNLGLQLHLPVATELTKIVKLAIFGAKYHRVYVINLFDVLWRMCNRQSCRKWRDKLMNQI